MTLAAIPGLLVAFIVVMLPGAALLLALRVRRPLWLIGAAPAASIGVATATAILCALVGLPYGVASLGVVVAVLLALGVLWWVRDGRGPALRINRVTGLVAAVLAVLGTGYAVHTWMLGLGGALTTLPQEHDTIMHSELVAYIQRTGQGAPWELLPVDVLTGGPITFYPSGMHLLAAVTGAIMGNPIVGLNAVTVVLMAVVLAMSVAALGYVALRRARVGVGAAAIGAGVATIVAAGLNSPTITLTSMGGILANATSFVLTPGVVAVLLSLRQRDWLAGVAAGFACAGAVLAHPSAVVSVGVTLVAWWIGEAFSKGGLRRLAQQLPVLAVTGLAAGVLSAATLIPASTVSGVTSNWPPDFPKLPFSEALVQTFGMRYMGYLPIYDGRAQVAALTLAVLGVVAVLVARRGFGAVTAYAAWSVIVLGAWLSPGTGFEKPITGFFYNAMLRLKAHQSLLVPVLAALGVVLTARAVAAWLSRRSPLSSVRMRPVWVSAALVALVMLTYLVMPAREYARASAHYLQSRYGKPDLHRITADDQAAFDFLADRVGPGERVLNSANDGSTYLYVEKNIPVVNVSTLGVSAAPYTYKLLQRFNAYPTDTAIRKMVLDLNITWVYVDYAAPTIGAGIVPENWVGAGTFTQAPGLDNLEEVPGLSEEFRSGAVEVYRVDQTALRQM